MIDTNDLQVVGAGGAGIGSWYLPLSQALQISISFATLIFISIKIYQLLKHGKKNDCLASCSHLVRSPKVAALRR
jgi:hypothetical protein